MRWYYNRYNPWTHYVLYKIRERYVNNEFIVWIIEEYMEWIFDCSLPLQRVGYEGIYKFGEFECCEIGYEGRERYM